VVRKIPSLADETSQTLLLFPLRKRQEKRNPVTAKSTVEELKLKSVMLRTQPFFPLIWEKSGTYLVGTSDST